MKFIALYQKKGATVANFGMTAVQENTAWNKYVCTFNSPVLFDYDIVYTIYNNPSNIYADACITNKTSTGFTIEWIIGWNIDPTLISIGVYPRIPTAEYEYVGKKIDEWFSISNGVMKSKSAGITSYAVSEWKAVLNTAFNPNDYYIFIKNFAGFTNNSNMATATVNKEFLITANTVEFGMAFFQLNLTDYTTYSFYNTQNYYMFFVKK